MSVLHVETCGATAYDCYCGRVESHPPPHECDGETCRAQWTGTWGTEDWAVVRYPLGLEVLPPPWTP